MEREVLAVAVREQRLFGKDLHDGLSQHLTGLKFKASLLELRLRDRKLPEADDARAISTLLDEAIEEASRLSRAAQPVDAGVRGLMVALRALAARTERKYRIRCKCDFRRPLLLRDNDAATHAYRVIEEAVVNAFRNGEATEVVISASQTRDVVALTVQDNGLGLPKNYSLPESLGLCMMRHRARMIGGSVKWRRNASRGTTVVLRFKKPTTPPSG